MMSRSIDVTTGAHLAEPTHFSFADIPWIDERSEPDPAPETMIREAEQVGARRKQLARGEGGFHSQFTTMPAGFEVPPHSHDFDELFIVLAGGCTMGIGGSDAVELIARDSVAMAAGKEYGFTVGPDGIEFIVVRPGAARSSYA